MFHPMTATQFIRELKQLPAKERSKVFAYVGTSISRREDAADRRAVTAAKRDKRPSVSLDQVKRELGLA